MPDDISITPVSDQSVFIRHSLRNAELAALIGAILAMTVIYLFLGSVKRTLIIGSAIPIGILVTFVIMDINGLTLNIMTLGGLALGLGLLIDSTIVMLENITRHQHDGGPAEEYAVTAAQEVNSPIIASTSTNLAAILPFLFIGGLTGLLFKELIITISSAMVAALIVALTLVPALGAKIKQESSENTALINNLFNKLKQYYSQIVNVFITHHIKTIFIFIIIFSASILFLSCSPQDNMPSMDDGRVSINISGDPDIHLDTLDETTDRIEELILEQPEVKTLFTIAGGRIFGRTESISSNKSTVVAQLVSISERNISSADWVKKMEEKIKDLNLTGYKVRMRPPRVRGLKLSRGDDDISLRIQGDDLAVLRSLGDEIVDRLQGMEGIRNVTHTYEETSEELKIQIDRQRAADLGISVDELGEVLRIALEGRIISEYIEGDRQFDIRLRLPRKDTATPEALGNILVGFHQNIPVRLREIAEIEYGPAPTKIMRDQQQRIVEISASLIDGTDLREISTVIDEKLEGLKLPKGYFLYDAGFSKTLKSGQQEIITLLALAIFLVFAVMTVQYESLRNPLVIIFSVPFAAIGVALGLGLRDVALSMPVFLGMIMLAGIVVNNAIMLVEQIEIEREKITDVQQAIANAASLRLRPILMTTLTTVFGMMPLAIGLGEGSEMLQPLAFVIVWGLSFSMLVTLVLIPAMYKIFHFSSSITEST
jgi:multidrug efflux pump subunit AcrB